MLQYLLDTDHLTLYQHGHASVAQRVALHRGEVGISVVTIYEALAVDWPILAQASDRNPTGFVVRPAGAGRSNSSNSSRLSPSTKPPSMSSSSFTPFASVTRDRKIASIALANQLIVVTRNRRDFSRVPGLTIEDWSV